MPISNVSSSTGSTIQLTVKSSSGVTRLDTSGTIPSIEEKIVKINTELNDHEERIDTLEEKSVVDDALSDTSEFPVQNKVITEVLNTKQNTLTAGANIQIVGDTISATDTTYTAGTGIDITNGVISNTQTSAEWGNITGTLSAQRDLKNALDAKMDTVNLADVATSGSYNDLSDKPNIPSDTNDLTNGAGYITNSDIPTIGNATLTIQKNSETVDTFTSNATVDKIINITVPTTASEVDALPNSTKYGYTIDLNLNETDYKLTITLKDQDGNILSSKVVDFPLESVVVSGSYDSTNEKIVLTLQNGNTIDIPVGALISGLQTEITSTNKLDADLVDDSTSTNKFVTSGEKTTWNGKQDVISDLSAIRTNATNGASAYTTIQNYGNIVTHNVSEFATSAQGALADSAVQPSDLATVATSGSYNDLIDKPTIPAAQVNADWNANSGVAQILNKPTIPTVNNARITLTQGGTTKGSFTLNQSSSGTIDLDAGGSGSSYTAGDGIIIDNNEISVDGVNTDEIEIDDVPTQNSTNLITSGGVYSVLGDIETLINAL